LIALEFRPTFDADQNISHFNNNNNTDGMAYPLMDFSFALTPSAGLR
jgi:hypothetical protein